MKVCTDASRAFTLGMRLLAPRGPRREGLAFATMNDVPMALVSVGPQPEDGSQPPITYRLLGRTLDRPGSLWARRPEEQERTATCVFDLAEQLYSHL